MRRIELVRGYGRVKKQGHWRPRSLWSIGCAERADADGVELGDGSIGDKVIWSACRGEAAAAIEPTEEALRGRFASLWERDH